MTSDPITPDWREVLQDIPPDFRDNGASSPFQFLYGFIMWGGRRRADIALAARMHDFGYGPARLPGSGYEHITKEGWDAAYRQCLIDRGHPIIAGYHWSAVNRLGGRAWYNTRNRMQKWEWFTYQNFLADIDKSYSGGISGIR